MMSTVAEAALAAAGAASAVAASMMSPARTAPLPPPPSTKTISTRTPARNYDIDDNTKLRDDMVAVEPRCCTAVAVRGDRGFRDRGGIPKLSVPSTAASTATSAAPTTDSAPEMASTVEVPARTRVLRRVSSIRALFLGAAREGRRLTTFSQQMGLPHDEVVAYVQVQLYNTILQTILQMQDTISYAMRFLPFIFS